MNLSSQFAEGELLIVYKLLFASKILFAGKLKVDNLRVMVKVIVSLNSRGAHLFLGLTQTLTIPAA